MYYLLVYILNTKKEKKMPYDHIETPRDHDQQELNRTFGLCNKTTNLFPTKNKVFL